MKILSSKQIRDADAYTIAKEPVSSIHLMERASMAFTDWFVSLYNNSSPVSIVCGPGNNGGDGLAIARMLSQKDYSITVYLFLVTSKCTPDFEENLARLKEITAVDILQIGEGHPMPKMPSGSIIIDAILGSGLTRNANGIVEDVIRHLNIQPCKRVSVDIPSGLFADRYSNGTTIKAERTLSFQLPKLAFMFPENYGSVGEWSTTPIGLHPQYLKETETFFHYVNQDLAASLYRERTKFSHKGTYGHALIIAGSKRMLGAAVLATKACIKSGAGLVTVHAPRYGLSILQSTVPEAMVSLDSNEQIFTKVTDYKKYAAIGIGCGLGTEELTQLALRTLLLNFKKPIILDADALNILALNKDWIRLIPKNSILTPHPKEFERLFGATNNNFERNELQVSVAQDLSVYIVLKGAHTCIATPGGNSYYNSTGNPGMATAGSGDVLTGIITGLLASGYGPFSASVLGVYLHGLAGDLALGQESMESLVASNLIDNLGNAFKMVKG